MTEVSAGWSRVQPPLFLWGAVVLSPAVMGLAGDGPPSRLALAAIGLFVALGFFELSPRRGRVPAILVALLYVLLATALAGPPLGPVEAVFTAAVLVSGALCASICAGLVRIAPFGRVAPLITFLVAGGGLFLIAISPYLAAPAAQWRPALQSGLCLGAVAALIHGQMLRIGQAAEEVTPQRIWMVETLSLLVGLGLVWLLAAVAEGWAETLGLAVCLMLAAAALHNEIGPRVTAVTAVLYFAAHAEPLPFISAPQTAGFLALIIFALLPLRALGRAGFAAPEEPLWFTALQPAAEAWMVTFDLGREEVILGPAAQAHFGPQRRLAVWLEQLSPKQSGQLLALLLGRETAPVSVTLRGAGPRGSASPYAVHLLERAGSRSRVLLRRLSAEAALSARAAELQAELDRIRLREERLLALASHELRTPVATLAMLAEEIDEGEAWDEIGPNFHAAIAQVLAVLDDLRASGRSEGTLARAGEVSLAQITSWMRDEFGPLAEALGVTLQLEIPEAEGPQYICETGRLLLVLEKLMRHALNLPDLRRLRLSLMAVPLGGDRLTLVWTLLPMGEAVLPMPDPTLFEPFATGPEAGLGSRLQGAGLYTADKAAIAMGGLLKVQRDPAGFLFVFTHPVRRLAAPQTARRP